MDKPILLGLVEASRRLNLAVGTVRRYADEGVLLSMRDSAGRRLFLPADVEALAKRRRMEKARRLAERAAR